MASSGDLDVAAGEIRAVARLSEVQGLRAAVVRAYHLGDPATKCASVTALDRAACAAALAVTDARDLPAVGRPAQPRLVHPRDVPRRSLGSPAGRIALAHAVAHIEFNAINLALDAALRFAGLPSDYYLDWLGVALDEARHFSLLRDWLQAHGSDYGALDAHDGLWSAAERTAGDPLLRMALVPRVLEARGLDVTPGMIARLREVGEPSLVAVLEVILREEVAHVAIGTRWFHHLCAQRVLDPVATFRTLLVEHGVTLHPPFNHAARLRAGFVPAEFT